MITENMDSLISVEVERDSEEEIQLIDFNWMDNPSVQKLLDVVVSIIAEEYIEIARQNPDVFGEHPHLSSPLKGEEPGERE